MLDRAAIALSGLCLVHCLATAIFVGLLSSLGAVLGAPIIHEAGLALAIVLAAIALGRGLYLRRRFLPAAIGGLGLGVMGGALALPHGGWEAAATIVGVSILALGHHLNRVEV